MDPKNNVWRDWRDPNPSVSPHNSHLLMYTGRILGRGREGGREKERGEGEGEGGGRWRERERERPLVSTTYI
jgi:hypothetical protein